MARASDAVRAAPDLRPQVASRSRWARIEALLRNRAFAAEYAEARERWRAGIPAVFPPGTYWRQRFASVLVPVVTAVPGGATIALGWAS